MNTKFLVKVNRGSTRATEYVQRIDPAPIQMTPNRKLALAMGRFTAEDAIKLLQNSRCSPELVSVQATGFDQKAYNLAHVRQPSSLA